MNKIINVLIVENQSLIIDVFKRALETVSDSCNNLDFKLSIVSSCEFALAKIKNVTSNNLIDLMLLNINIPPFGSKNLIFADDLALELRKLSPKTKIIVFVFNCDNFRINTIMKTLDPESILVNTDIDFKELTHAIKTVLIRPPYYSRAILHFIRRHITNDFILDKIDRLILHHLSIGVKNKDLPSLIGLSKGGIERRKRILKDIFNVENGNDKMLFKAAQERGII